MSGSGMSGSAAAPPAASATLSPAARCALCGNPNGCAMAEGADSAKACWCMDETVAPPLAERLKDEGAEWCICQACMRRAQQQKEGTS